MICVHCGYKHGYHWDDSVANCVETKGEEGEFYKLNIKLERERPYSNYPETVELFGCPSCNKTFIRNR